MYQTGLNLVYQLSKLIINVNNAKNILFVTTVNDKKSL